MYYPKSQIKTNLYTRGKEFVFSDTNQEYRGYYYITSMGQVYSGKTPSDPTSQPLQSSGQNVSDTATQQRDVEPEFIGSLIEDASFYLLPLSYINSTSLDVGSAPPPPKQTYPIPTDNDYKLGEFQRYFLKKSNELKFIEISLEDYGKYTTQDRNVMFELYTPIQINWILTGEEKQVYQVNQSIVARAEREQNLPGFTQYFRGKFTQFYK